MPSVKPPPVLISEIPIGTHSQYASWHDYLQEVDALLPQEHPHIVAAIPAARPPKHFSHLNQIPFFDVRTLSWSWFLSPPYEAYDIPFSSSYFLQMLHGSKKFALYQSHELVESKEARVLQSLFTLHEDLQEMIQFVKARCTVQKA